MFETFDVLVTSVYVLGIVLVWMVITFVIYSVIKYIKEDVSKDNAKQ